MSRALAELWRVLGPGDRRDIRRKRRGRLTGRFDELLVDHREAEVDELSFYWTQADPLAAFLTSAPSPNDFANIGGSGLRCTSAQCYLDARRQLQLAADAT